LLLVVAGVVVLCFVNQRKGQDWGDDFALYIRQAKALTRGNVGEVIADNRYTVDNSSWHTFSPTVYSWGFPILLAPFYAWKGLDYHVFKVVLTLCFGGFLFLFGRIVTRRAGTVGGILCVLVIGLSVQYVGWTDTVLSEFPFLLFVALTLWWLDRVRTTVGFESERLWPLVLLGLLGAYAFAIRREGMALLVAVAAAQLAYLATVWRQRRPGHPYRPRVRWSRIATPHVTAITFIVVLQLVLPAVPFERYPNTGRQQLRPNWDWYWNIFAEQLGLKDQGNDKWNFAGSEHLAHTLLGVFMFLAVAGIVLRLVLHFSDDAPLAGYLLAVSFIFGITPFHEGRYLFSITPFLVYFAYQGVACLFELFPRFDDRSRTESRVAKVAFTSVAGFFIFLFVCGNGSDLWRRTALRLDYGDYVIWGPEDPSATEMFAAVQGFTRGDDKIGFFRARAMNLYTDRQSVQLTTLPDILQKSDYYAMAKNSTYSQKLLTDQEAEDAGLTKVWENANWVLWRVPPR
jgi:hypothetical protein